MQNIAYSLDNTYILSTDQIEVSWQVIYKLIG